MKSCLYEKQNLYAVVQCENKVKPNFKMMQANISLFYTTNPDSILKHNAPNLKYKFEEKTLNGQKFHQI